MRHDEQSGWERELDEALKALLELQAPPVIAENVLAEIRRRQSRPWYRQAWQSWPLLWRAASLLILAGFTVGIGFGLWQLFGRSIGREVDSLATTAAALWDAATAVAGAGVLAVKHLDSVCIAALLAVACTSYLLCIGAGTLVYRFARHSHKSP